MENTPAKDSLPELYPQCVSLRKELDSLLRTISSAPTLQAPAHAGGRSYAGPLGREVALKGAETQFGGWDGRGNGVSSVAKLQRFSALTRQFCMLVLRLQDALALAKSNGLSRNMYSIWERRIQDMVADAESFRREAEGRMNLEQQRFQEAMRDRKALLGDADRSTRWGDMRNAELMYAKERDRLHESRTVLDSMLSQGWSVVGQLVSQNASLKKARRKVLDMASSAGVASTLLGAVSRRQQGDKWLVYGGMILTLVFFFVVYRLVHHGSIFGFSSVAEVDAGTSSELTHID
ncbi:golgi SNARE protein, putative [Eimeria brunetti]|uniref:Golgi SNARE protein, putative n=1 Tax=Eimeria brunetti TaxID=51314 RepID=U6LE36_9EIME|nr:golgi SNARE protein, putative [Eimeria brunetti]